MEKSLVLWVGLASYARGTVGVISVPSKEAATPPKEAAAPPPTAPTSIPSLVAQCCQVGCAVRVRGAGIVCQALKTSLPGLPPPVTNPSDEYIILLVDKTHFAPRTSGAGLRAPTVWLIGPPMCATVKTHDMAGSHRWHGRRSSWPPLSLTTDKDKTHFSQLQLESRNSVVQVQYAKCFRSFS